jgi:predicted translin family RNA/ssDNA-binding protein
MLDKKEFAEIRKEIEKADKIREDIIALSRDIISISKRIIYSIHRGNSGEASAYIKEIKEKKRKLDRINRPVDANINKVAYQEYVEAMCYYGFVKNKKLPTKASLNVDIEDYLMGLCDLTGELSRRAVNDIIRKRFNEALKVKELVEEIYGEFLKFNLRNTELRKKSDSIKWNLKKLEDVIFDAKVKGMVK